MLSHGIVMGRSRLENGKRWPKAGTSLDTAPKSTHFYVFCLISFVLYSFQYTTQFDTFDWIIYWGNIAAGAIQPALFLHFAFSFSGVPAFGVLAVRSPGRAR